MQKIKWAERKPQVYSLCSHFCVDIIIYRCTCHSSTKEKKLYEALKDGFADAFSSMNSLINQIQIKVDGILIMIKNVFCADYKVCTII